MSGVFVAVVGPSGAGKDSLMREASQRLRSDEAFHFVRRVVTRPSSAHEDHDSLSPEAFAAAERVGAFALTWRAHDLSYGVPIGVDAEVARGRVVIANLSRAAVQAVRSRFVNSCVVLITASEATLAARLAARGREDVAARQGRVARANSLALPAPPDYIIENDGSLQSGVERLVGFLGTCREATTS